MEQMYTTCKICKSSINKVNTKHNLSQCTHCALVFCENLFTNEHFEKTYNALYNDTSQYKAHQKEFENLKNKTPLHVGRPKKRILSYLLENDVKSFCEIGAGVGVVASYLLNKSVAYTGIELDKKTVEKAQSLGLNIQNGDFSMLHLLEDKFDAVVAFEVIEHLQDLDLFFKLVYSKLSDIGYLGFTVPNYDKRKNYKNPGNHIYQSGPPIHLNFFTIESIAKIAPLYNFHVVFCEAKKLPYLNLGNLKTYTDILKAGINRYHGSTLMCVLQKNN